MATGELVPIRDLTLRDREAWHDLARHSLDANPFFEPEMAVPAAAHLGDRRPALAIVRHGSDMVACLPVVRAWKWGRTPIPVIAAWRHEYCYLGTPLLAPGREVEGAAALLSLLAGHAPPPGLVVLDWVADGPTADALTEAADGIGFHAAPWASFDRPLLAARQIGGGAGPGAGGGPASARRRRNLARLSRRLEEQTGRELRICDRSAEPGRLEEFLRLEASGWKGRAGTAMACRPGHGTFFRAMAQEFARQGRLDLIALESGDTAIAMKATLLANGDAFCFKSAFDERYASFSPGVRLEADHAARVCGGGRIRWMDSCTDPENDMINQVWGSGERRTLRTTIITPRRTLGRLTVAGWGAGRARYRHRRGSGA